MQMADTKKSAIMINNLQNLTLNPNFVTGFSDAECSFTISLVRTKKGKVGWEVQPTFQIGLHHKDKVLLEQLQNYFGPSSRRIFKHGPQSQSLLFKVQSIKELKLIINHFDKYPLITQKRADFELFKQIIERMSKKEHLTLEGLKHIVSIRASINKGLTPLLTNSFPNTIPCERPKVEVPKNIDPHWIRGFVDGEGSFCVHTQKSKTTKLGESVGLEFTISQHIRDEQLIKSLVQYLGCGRTRLDSRGSLIYFVVTRLSDIIEKILPFFVKSPLIGNKALDLGDFYKVASLMKAKGHLTKEGLEEIKKIKDGMNTRRLKNN